MFPRIEYQIDVKLLYIFAVETSLAEAQCYEIPVDSFETPQRIYMDGVRASPLAESLETPVSERSLTVAETNIIDQTQYCPAEERTSVSTDVTGQRESIPSSVGPGTHCRHSPLLRHSGNW
jgi:hypothetical protein